MSDFENKLNTILSDSNAMEQIMALARSLNGGQTSAQDVHSPSLSNDANGSDLSSPSLFGGLEPKFLEIAMKVMNAYNAEDNSRTNLLIALRPFIKKERYAKLDQAIRISKITRAVRTALDAFHENEGGTSNV